MRAPRKAAPDAREQRPYRGSAPEARVVLAGRQRPSPNSRERRVIANVSVSHPDRVFYPADAITKGELARYYEAAAPWMLPHVQGRPLTLVRCPESIEACAYMRHLKAWRHWPALRVIAIPEQRKVGEYMVADNASALVSLVQMDILELHTWNTTAPRIEECDRIVIDLDPGPGVEWSSVVEGARQVRSALGAQGLQSWVKTTGGVGLHVMAPLQPGASWEACLAFTRALARQLERADPRRFTASLERASRAGRIFVDYLRNNRGNSSVAFSARARDGAPVSTPLEWGELGRRRQVFTTPTVLRRLGRLQKDPWAGYFEQRQTLPDAR